MKSLRPNIDPCNTVVLGGARLWNIKANIDVAGAPMVSVEKSVTDPVLALCANVQLGPRWSAIAYIDVGGFGVGSDQTTQALITASFQVNDNLFLSAGYRRLDVDYEDEGTKIDWNMRPHSWAYTAVLGLPCLGVD